jgi:hypothetical protein
MLWTGFGVLVQEVVECRLYVPPLVQLPFIDFQVSWLDHPQRSVLVWGGLTGSRSGLTTMLCRLL